MKAPSSPGQEKGMPTAYEQTLLDAVLRRARDGGRCESVFFRDHREAPGGGISAACLSQWYPASFVLDGQRYLHAEQYMMAAKAAMFGDEATHRAILQTIQPAAAKTLGRNVQGFDEARWQAARFDTVLRANHAKFHQNATLGAFFAVNGQAAAGLGQLAGLHLGHWPSHRRRTRAQPAALAWTEPAGPGADASAACAAVADTAGFRQTEWAR